MTTYSLVQKLEILSDAADGRCISLLKILMTNFSSMIAFFCVNRLSSNVARARFSVEEVIALTLDFYRRNYIEGLFLSSGIIKSLINEAGFYAYRLSINIEFPTDLSLQRAETLDFSKVKIDDALMAMTKGRGPDSCIDCVGLESDAMSSFDAMIDKAKAALYLGTDRPHVLREAIYCCR